MKSRVQKILHKVLLGAFLVMQTICMFPSAEYAPIEPEQHKKAADSRSASKAIEGVRMQHWCAPDQAEKKALLWYQEQAAKEARPIPKAAVDYSLSFKQAINQKLDTCKAYNKQAAFAQSLVSNVYFDQAGDELFKNHLKGDIRDGLVSGGHFYNNEHNRECLYSGFGVDIFVMPPLGHKNGILTLNDLNSSLERVCQDQRYSDYMLSNIKRQILLFKLAKVDSWQEAQRKCADEYGQFEAAWNSVMIDEKTENVVCQNTQDASFNIFFESFINDFSNKLNNVERAFNDLFAVGCCIDVDFEGMRGAQQKVGLGSEQIDLNVVTIRKCLHKIRGEKSTKVLPHVAQALGSMKFFTRRLQLGGGVEKKSLAHDQSDKNHDSKNKAVQEIRKAKFQLQAALKSYLSCAKQVFFTHKKYLRVKSDSIDFVKTIFKESVIGSQDVQKVNIECCLGLLIDGILNDGYLVEMKHKSLEDIVDNGGHFFLDTFIQIKGKKILVRAWFSRHKDHKSLSLDSFYPLIDEPQPHGVVSAAADSDDGDDQGVQDHDEIQNAQWLFNEHWQHIEALLEPAWAHNKEEKEKAVILGRSNEDCKPFCCTTM
ncbi:MAG: hypothetical protein NT124_01865 [Candidatus Dependentiae bacterium]|nr:hypothetical protein [Candidatus Dependentiae bacterium]